ncbi:hypothetical protein FSP39_022976 [Pinctada imbricata]|uniref:DDE Tnp4 domain-containing protein n=1 Tax=Pinctada imbricata TaxID=66713 RepID=A0AA89C448_PINIB|nr:hypothetical protein FSP39_022976 [Pinctada imbricata]
MMVVTTTGYLVSVLGPYLADTRNNDSSILKHMLATNAEEMKNWIQEDDIFVVDRGFRDSADILQELGIKMQMSSFLQKGSKQHETEDSNNYRLVTKNSFSRNRKYHCFVSASAKLEIGRKIKSLRGFSIVKSLKMCDVGGFDVTVYYC